MDQAWEIIADGNGTESLRRVAGRMRCPAKANSDEVESVSARPRESGDPDSGASWRDLDARLRGHERKIGSTLSESGLTEARHHGKAGAEPRWLPRGFVVAGLRLEFDRPPEIAAA